MAVSIRLKRMGNRNNVFYRVVAADSRKARDGRFIEELGWYDPHKTEDKCKLKKERVEYWVSKGAQVSNTVKSLIKEQETGPKKPKPLVDSKPKSNDSKSELKEDVKVESKEDVKVESKEDAKVEPEEEAKIEPEEDSKSESEEDSK